LPDLLGRKTALIHEPTASEEMAVASAHLRPVPSLTPSKALTCPLHDTHAAAIIGML
jgi:hypothetical protein